MTYTPKYLNNQTKQELESEFARLLKKNVAKALKKEAFKQNKSSTRTKLKTANNNKNTKKQNSTNYSKDNIKNTTYNNLKAPTILKSASYQKKQSSIYSLMNYILKNTNELENELGNSIVLDKVNKESKRFGLLKDSENQKANSSGNKTLEENLSKRQVAHLVFSLPNNTEENEELLKEVLREALPEVFAGHKYSFGVHKNTNNMHCHIALKYKNDLTNKQLRLDGKKLLQINKLLYDKCEEKQLKLNKTFNLNGIEYDNEFKKKAPQFIQIDSSNTSLVPFVNKQQQEKKQNIKKQIQALNMEDKHQERFTQLYLENASFALSVLNKSPDFFNINKEDLEKYKQANNTKAIKLKRYPDYFYKKVPKFIELDSLNSLEKLTANESTLNKLKELGLDKENTNRFLNLYKEDNKLAISTLNNNPKFFKLTKKEIENYKQQNNLTHISFRKVNIIKIHLKEENIKHEQQ